MYSNFFANMNKQLLSLVAIALLATAACTQAPEAPKAEAGAPEAATETPAAAPKYKVDAAASTVTWVGTKLAGKHNGTFKVKEGSLSVEGDQLKSGSFVIDVNSLTALDLQAGKGKEDLEGHLKSPDFFDTAKFPDASFEITGVKPFVADPASKEPALAGATHTIDGNLTLKGVSKGISFPAVIAIDPSGKLTAQSNFNINRKDWGMAYGADESLKDKFIRPEVNVGFNISATK